MERSNWTFRIEEVSPGVYRVEGEDDRGRSVDRVDTDPDAAIAAAKDAAGRLTRDPSDQAERGP